MGLPIWNYSDGDEQKIDKTAKESSKVDPTITARSMIRRRASVHGRRNNQRARSRNGSNNRDPVALQFAPPRPPEPLALYAGGSAASTIRLRGGTVTIGRDSPHPTSHHERAEDVLDHDSFRAHRAPRSRQQHQRFPRSAALRQSAIHPLTVRHSPLVRRSTHRRRSDEENNDDHNNSDDNDDYSVSAAARHDHILSQSREENTSRTNLPTPPLDVSSLPTPSDILRRSNVASPHNLTFTARAPSPDNGLGDRRRSPSPNDDYWQVMRSTITPDDSLPSTSSSFTSAAAATASFHDLSRHADDQDFPRIAGPQYDQGRDLSFDDTMREMGIEVSSPSASASSSDHNMTSDEEDVCSNSGSDDADIEHPSESEQLHIQRTNVAMRLYDLAMSTPEGRRQIEALRSPAHLSSYSAMPPYTDPPIFQEPVDMTGDMHTLPTPLSHSEQHEAASTSVPLPEPDQFGTEVHSRALEATSSTHAFFENNGRGADRNRVEEARR